MRLPSLPMARRRGAILVLVAILVPVLAIMAAFAVDVAWMQLVRTELRTATDAASRAGAKELSASQNIARARAAAIEAAGRNRVAGKGLPLATEDIEFGSSEQTAAGARFVFTPVGNPINAIRVTGRRQQGSAGGPVALFFGRLMGVRQFEPVQTATSTILDRDICLVLDRSGSMLGQKIQDLKDAVAVFFDELDDTFPEEQVALASYSTTSRLDATLTTNFDSIHRTVNAFEADGRTAIGLALRDGIRGVTGRDKRPFAVPTIVLMTDGLHNTGVEPIVPARQAAAQRITVHTVTFGRDADLRRMREVAETTGGEHFHANSGRDLQEVFREIARTLPVLLTE